MYPDESYQLPGIYKTDRLEVSLYLLTQEEGGRELPLDNEAHPHLCFVGALPPIPVDGERLFDKSIMRPGANRSVILRYDQDRVPLGKWIEAKLEMNWLDDRSNKDFREQLVRFFVAGQPFVLTDFFWVIAHGYVKETIGD
jgi:hypothetical protein